MTNWRQRSSLICTIGVFVVGLVAGPLLYVTNVIEDEDAFVALTNNVLVEPEVRRFVAAEATTVAFDAAEADELIAELLPDEARALSVPATQIATQQLTNAAFELLDTEVGSNATDATLRQLHGEVTGDAETVVIDLRAVLVQVSRDVGGPTIGAAVAKAVSGTEAGRFVLAEPDSSAGRLIAVLRGLPAIGGFVALVLVILAIASIALAPDWRRTLTRVGLAMAASALISVIMVTMILTAAFGSAGEVGLAIADVIGVDFASQQQGFLLTGALLALIGLLLGPRPAAVALRRLPGDLWHRDERLPATVSSFIGDNPPLARVVVWAISTAVLLSWGAPTLRVVLTIMAITVVAQAVIWAATDPGDRAARWRQTLGLPEPAATDDGGIDGPSDGRNDRIRGNLAIVSIGVAVLWPAYSMQVILRLFVAAALLQAAVDLLPARRMARAKAPAAESATAEADAADGFGPIPGRWLAPAAMAAVAAVAIGASLVLGSTETSAAATGCNGHPELCDRPIDEVVFAGSHNAMSSIDLGWKLAMQDGDMVDQLDHGVRALLIDALYWIDEGRAEDRVEGGDDPAAAAVIEAALGDDVPRAGTWLCHGFCALGATDLTAGLASVNAWLVSNPREVLLIIVQDEVDPDDLEEAFEDSGLLDQVHVRSGDGPWPTLGELIEADERVLVWAENGGEPGTWIQNGYDDTFTETPFNFALRSEFSCEPNRGQSDNPLFLINHWLTTGIPVREAAAAANGRDALLDRVRQCEEERGLRPTILAVDFVETGDLVEVVAELNGVAASS